MTAACTITVIGPAQWADYRALRLAALAQAPAAFGSSWEAESAYPDEQWRWRLTLASSSGKDLPLMASVHGVPSGLAYGKVDPHQAGVVNLYQMWVDPALRGQGLGLALVERVIAWARQSGAHAVQLGVVTGQAAALRTYRKAGFVPVGPAEPLRAGSALLSQPMRLQLAQAE